jgi:hypothetical protein
LAISALFAVMVLWSKLSAAPDSRQQPIRVEAKVESVRQRFDPPYGRPGGIEFDAIFRIVNTSNSPMTFWIWTCGWCWNWTSNNPAVKSDCGPCTRNSCFLLTLKPSQAYERRGRMIVSDAEGAEKVTFRIGFTSSPPRSKLNAEKTYWSDEVTVRLVEP